MSKNEEADKGNFVKKQTLFGAVVLSLVIGFIAGTIYASFKLTSDTKALLQKSSPSGNSSAGEQDNSAQFSTKIVHLEQYLEKHPKDADAWAQMGNHFFDSNQFKNAINAYTKSLAIAPENIGVVTDLGVMYRKNKQPEKAIELFDKAISMDSAFETARFNKGIVLLHDLNDMEGGIKAWEELVKQNPFAMAPNGESVDALILRMKNQK